MKILQEIRAWVEKGRRTLKEIFKKEKVGLPTGKTEENPVQDVGAKEERETFSAKLQDYTFGECLGQEATVEFQGYDFEKNIPEKRMFGDGFRKKDWTHSLAKVVGSLTIGGTKQSFAAYQRINTDTSKRTEFRIETDTSTHIVARNERREEYSEFRDMPNGEQHEMSLTIEERQDGSKRVNDISRGRSKGDITLVEGASSNSFNFRWDGIADILRPKCRFC